MTKKELVERLARAEDRVAHLERAIRTGGAAVRAERAMLGVPGGIDPTDESATCSARPSGEQDPTRSIRCQREPGHVRPHKCGAWEWWHLDEQLAAWKAAEGDDHGKVPLTHPSSAPEEKP